MKLSLGLPAPVGDRPLLFSSPVVSHITDARELSQVLWREPCGLYEIIESIEAGLAEDQT